MTQPADFPQFDTAMRSDDFDTTIERLRVDGAIEPTLRIILLEMLKGQQGLMRNQEHAEAARSELLENSRNTKSEVEELRKDFNDLKRGEVAELRTELDATKKQVAALVAAAEAEASRAVGRGQVLGFLKDNAGWLWPLAAGVAAWLGYKSGAPLTYHADGTVTVE